MKLVVPFEPKGERYNLRRRSNSNTLSGVAVVARRGKGWSKLETWFDSQYQRIMSRRLELKDFIKRARKTHGNKYTYASVQYQNIDSKVKIKCPTHGYFDQIAWNHIGRPRSGCPKCGDLQTAAKRRSKNANAFISEARKVHGKRYDYSKAIYRSINKPVCVICTKHGEFWPTPHNHINLRCRCFKCAKKEIANELILRF